MRFLARCVRAYREAALEYSYNEFVEGRENWTKEDQERTSAYFYSETGAKLRARLSNYAIRETITATREPKNTKHNNGIARGIWLCVRAVEDHIPERPERVTEREPTETAIAALR